MTTDQEAHAWEIIDDFNDLAYKKYKAGAKEHGGNIWDIPLMKLMDEAKLEFIDGFIYTSTAINTLEFLLGDPIIAKRVKVLMELQPPEVPDHSSDMWPEKKVSKSANGRGAGF